MTGQDGDPDLADRLHTALGRRHEPAAIATVSEAGVRVASLGVELGSDFEIGSISKGVTGLLYAEALTRGEIDASTTLGALLPLGGTPVAQISLASISTHRSGLPRLPNGSAPLRKTIELWRHGSNPYGENLDALLEQARHTKVGRPKSLYSNVGFELLGHALAQAAATSYPELVEKRLAEPLAISTLYAPGLPGGLRPTALIGLMRDHRTLAGLLADFETSLAELGQPDDRRGGRDQLDAELDRIEAVMRCHFSDEERHLHAVLRTLGADPSEKEGLLGAPPQ